MEIDMSNYKKHAMVEFKAAGWTDENGKYKDEMQESICNHVLKLLDMFAEDGHSGTTAPYTIDLFKQLALFKPLAPLTGEDDEWHDVSGYSGKTLYQNKRASHVFKDENGAYDIDGKVFWEWVKSYDDDGNPIVGKSYYTSYDSRTPVTFPYNVPEKQIYEYRYSDAEPKQPAQNEEGFL